MKTDRMRIEEDSLTRKAFFKVREWSDNAAAENYDDGRSGNKTIVDTDLIRHDESEDWKLLRECKDVDPKVFFPERGNGLAIAKEICKNCIVREDCLDYAIKENIHHGVWGGTSERERQRIVRLRRKTNNTQNLS